MCADVKAKPFFTVNLPRGQKKHLRGLDLTATYDIIEYNRKSKNSEVRQPHRAYGKRRLLMENITLGKTMRDSVWTNSLQSTARGYLCR